MPTDEVCLGRREDERESALARGTEEKREREEKKKEGKAREKKEKRKELKGGKRAHVHVYTCTGVCVYCVYVHMYTSKKSALPHKGPNARRNTRILARASAL